MKWAAGIAAAALFGAALGWVVSDEGHANDRYDRSRSALLGTRHQIGTVNQELGVARQQLHLVIQQVGNDATALSQETSELKAAQIALAAALGHASRQNTQIGSLHVCLGGVEQALNALAVNHRARAISALSAVATSCTEATASA